MFNYRKTTIRFLWLPFVTPRLKSLNILNPREIWTQYEVYDLSPYNLYENLEHMLEKEELDAISLAVPTYLHAEMACSLLERGYHVFCEKPMARHSAEAWKMVAAAQSSGKKLLIGNCLRFW